MKATHAIAKIEAKFKTARGARAVLRALKPEEKIEGSRVRAELCVNGRILRLKLTAADTSSLRAAVNSYLRWIAMAREIVERCD